MCHVFVITDESLTKEEKSEKMVGIKKSILNPTVRFFTRSERNFDKNLFKYQKKHPRAKEWRH